MVLLEMYPRGKVSKADFTTTITDAMTQLSPFACSEQPICDPQHAMRLLESTM
jgi:hypothetical protein